MSRARTPKAVRTASIVLHGVRYDLTRHNGAILVSQDGCTPVAWGNQTLALKLWDRATRRRLDYNPGAMLAVIEFETDSVEEVPA